MRDGAVIGVMVYGMAGCGGMGAAPPNPSQAVPQSPVDSRSNGWGDHPKAVDVVIDASVPAKIQASQGISPVLMCTTTPCLTRFRPGAYTLIADVEGEDTRCNVMLQISARPTIVQLNLVPGSWTECGITLWSPEDQVIYSGKIR